MAANLVHSISCRCQISWKTMGCVKILVQMGRLEERKMTAKQETIGMLATCVYPSVQV